MTDIGLYGKTDAGDMQDDFANKDNSDIRYERWWG